MGCCICFIRRISAIVVFTRNEHVGSKTRQEIYWTAGRQPAFKKGLCIVGLFYFYVILTESNAILCLARVAVWVLLSMFICFHPEEEDIYFSETLITIYMVSYHRSAWPLFSLFPRFFYISFHFYSLSKPRFGWFLAIVAFTNSCITKKYTILQLCINL